MESRAQPVFCAKVWLVSDRMPFRNPDGGRARHEEKRK
jgi:hypothetical protein